MKRSLIPTLIAALFLYCAGCEDESKGTGPTAGDDEVRIGVYNGRGTDGDCVRATVNMFEWMDCTVVRLSASYINTNGLDGFDLFCVPGGNMYEYAQDISAAGKAKIKTFISEGGGYIGICGGAYFAAERVVWQGAALVMTPLKLFPGTAEGVLDEIIPYPDYGMCLVNIVNLVHPITAAVADSAWILYYWGPALAPKEGADVSVLGIYERADRPAIVAFEYGGGRVFLTGPHPEFEEDDERDGVSFADDLDDRGSDWDLMHRALRWCLKKE